MKTLVTVLCFMLVVFASVSPAWASVGSQTVVRYGDDGGDGDGNGGEGDGDGGGDGGGGGNGGGGDG